MARKRRQYTDEFKQDAVRLLLESGRALDAVARDLDVTPSSLFRWREEFGPQLVGARATGELKGNERVELEELRRQVRVLEEEREILKKAAAFFAKESTK
jgi:transposase